MGLLGKHDRDPRGYLGDNLHLGSLAVGLNALNSNQFSQLPGSGYGEENSNSAFVAGSARMSSDSHPNNSDQTNNREPDPKLTTSELFFSRKEYRTMPEVAERIHVPENPQDIGRSLLIWTVPKSGGTILETMIAYAHIRAGMSPDKVGAGFQKVKGIYRSEDDRFVIPAQRRNIFKEVSGPILEPGKSELLDFADIYRNVVGIPREKLTVLIEIRHPVNTFLSLQRIYPNFSALDFVQMYNFLYDDMYTKHSWQNILQIVPFSFDSLDPKTGHKPMEVLATLLTKIGLGDVVPYLDGTIPSPEMLRGELYQYFDFGQADPYRNEEYFEQVFARMSRGGENAFRYDNRVDPQILAAAQRDQIEIVKLYCMNTYNAFSELAHQFLIS